VNSIISVVFYRNLAVPIGRWVVDAPFEKISHKSSMASTRSLNDIREICFNIHIVRAFGTDQTHHSSAAASLKLETEEVKMTVGSIHVPTIGPSGERFLPDELFPPSAMRCNSPTFWVLHPVRGHDEESLGKRADAVKVRCEMGLSLSELRDGLPEGGLFGGGAWRWSPEPLKLSATEVRQMVALGHPLACFQQACDSIYRRSAGGKLPDWLSQLLDRGKPDWLVKMQRAQATVAQFPRVIRPDLILTESGFSMTELDSVPGGIGVTAWLSRVYSDAGFEVLGGRDGMREGFRSLMPSGGKVLISEESKDYRPEMAWLAAELGEAWQVASAETYESTGEAVYRFFELFDWKSVPSIRRLADEILSGGVAMTPPLKPHLEDKLWLALLWSPALKKVWEQSLRGNHLKRLREITPFGWVLDSTPLPPHAALPRIGVHSWDEVASMSQRERQLVLKISGFHETAWGSRGVYIGHDLSGAEWSERLLTALRESEEQPWIMQEFREGRRVEHPVFREDGSVEMMVGRVRLCPYFFTDDAGETSFGGCLATLVPADKKKIHGMSDGVLIPCVMG
jgi:hypothetical protein